MYVWSLVVTDQLGRRKNGSCRGDCQIRRYKLPQNIDRRPGETRGRGEREDTVRRLHVLGLEYNAHVIPLSQDENELLESAPDFCRRNPCSFSTGNLIPC